MNANANTAATTIVKANINAKGATALRKGLDTEANSLNAACRVLDALAASTNANKVLREDARALCAALGYTPNKKGKERIEGLQQLFDRLPIRIDADGTLKPARIKKEVIDGATYYTPTPITYIEAIRGSIGKLSKGYTPRTLKAGVWYTASASLNSFEAVDADTTAKIEAHLEAVKKKRKEERKIAQKAVEAYRADKAKK